MRVYFCDESIAQSAEDITTVTAVGVKCKDIAELDKVVRSFRDKLFHRHILSSGRVPSRFELKGSYIKSGNWKVYLALFRKVFSRFDIEVISIYSQFQKDFSLVDMYQRLISEELPVGSTVVIDTFGGISKIRGGCMIPVASQDSMVVQFSDVINARQKATYKKDGAYRLNRQEKMLVAIEKEIKGSRD